MAATASWQISTVAIAGYSTWSSLAFSPSGQAAVAFFSSDNHALMFATLNPGGTWAVGTVDTVSGDCAPHLRFRFRQAAITYHEMGSKELRYALNRGGTPPWTITRVAAGGYGNSLAIGPSHRPGVSFAQPDKTLGYAHSDDPSVWVGTTVDGDGVHFNSLAFTPSDQPAIAYSTSDGQGHDLIKYAVFDGTNWSKETVGDGWVWCTLAFSPSGEPAISYSLQSSSSSEMSVIYAVLQEGSWNRETIATPGSGPSLAFTPAGGPAISYHHEGVAAVYYAVFADRAWQHLLVQKAGKDQQGVFSGPFALTSLAFNPTSGQPAISYYDRATGEIRCAIGTVSGGQVAPIVGGMVESRTVR